MTGVNHTKVILDIRSARTYHTVIFLKNIYNGIIKKGKEINSGAWALNDFSYGILKTGHMQLDTVLKDESLR